MRDDSADACCDNRNMGLKNFALKRKQSFPLV